MRDAVTFANLSPAAMQMSVQAILASADLVLLLWPDGEIAEASFGPSARLGADAGSLRGNAVSDIAVARDRAALSRIVDDARHRGVSDPVSIRHTEIIGARTSASYTAHLAGDGKNVILIGTLTEGGAQLAEKLVEAEIARSRTQNNSASESRYQTLFEASMEGVIVVDVETGRIEEANGKASAILECAVNALIGSSLDSHFTSEAPVEAPDALEAEYELTTLKGKECRLESRVVRLLDRTVRMVRLKALPNVNGGQEQTSESQPVQLVRKTSVPIIIANKDGMAVWANAAFGALVPGVPIESRGVSDLLGLTPNALEIALVETDRHGRLLTSFSALESRHEALTDAQVAIVSISAGEPEGYGFVIHETPFDEIQEPAADRPISGVEASTLADMVGQFPMKDLVRRSTDEIERYCIDAALKLTGSNRTEAANVLGLSRQSFYLKLHQHRLL